MKLLVDEDTQARRLIDLLKAAGHNVASVGDLGLNGVPDADVFATAQKLSRAVLTHNCLDFVALAEAAVHHFGVLGVYREADPKRCMAYPDIVQAIANLVSSGTSIPDEFHVLNQWR